MLTGGAEVNVCALGMEEDGGLHIFNRPQLRDLKESSVRYSRA